MKPTEPSISVFVAMPYTSFGEKAKWKKPEHVEAFYEAVKRRIEVTAGRPVKLEIERYRSESGIVHEKMFRAAYEADVFIADLTGANANVFFELGVRYGVRRAVTVLTSQEDTTPFDLAPMRLVRYANRPDEMALAEIASIVASGLEKYRDQASHSDSPVLDLLKLEVVPGERWQRVAGIRVQELLTAAKSCADPDQKLELLRQAVESDPVSLAARIELVKALRLRQDYFSGLREADSALLHFPASPSLQKERGLLLDRMSASGDNRIDEAIAAYRRALELDSRDADLLCCLGGALRRKGIAESGSGAPGSQLEEALGCYRQAIGIQRHSTYAGLNVLRLMILIRGGGASDAELRDYLRRMYHLCAFEATDSAITGEEQRWWRMFDFGDTQIFSEERDEALHTYREAIELIPEPVR